MDNAKDNLEFVIHRSNIVNSLIGELFLNPEQEEEDDDSTPITKANAMKLFKIQEDGSYLITIKNPLRFWLAIDHTSVSILFRQIAAVITQHRNRCKNHKLAGLRDHMVGQFVRVLVVVALEMIANVIVDPSVWAFALVADASTHFGVPMLDQRARMCFKGKLITLHLVLIPFFERHTVVNYVKLISAILHAMYSSWCDELILLNSDGENTMTGQIGGVIKLLEDQCTNPILQIWCVPHQLDLIVKKATQFVAHLFSVHLRAHVNLIPNWVQNAPKIPPDGSRSAKCCSGIEAPSPFASTYAR